MTQIVCGPLDGASFADEIPFVCSLFEGLGGRVKVLYGWACAEEHLWEETEVAAAELAQRVERSIGEGIYRPGSSDLFLTAADRLRAQLCHEADIHVTTGSATVLRECASRWLSRGWRVARSDESSPTPESWREVRTVEEAVSGV